MYWQCPECNNVFHLRHWTYRQLAEKGDPVCPMDDTDMKLQEGTPDGKSYFDAIRQTILDNIEDTTDAEAIREVVKAHDGKPAGKRFKAALAAAFPCRTDVMLSQRHGFTTVAWGGWALNGGESGGCVYIANTDKGAPIIDFSTFDDRNISHYAAAVARNEQRETMLANAPLLQRLADNLETFAGAVEELQTAFDAYPTDFPDAHDIARIVGIESLSGRKITI
jgi:hypothetical protein